MAHNDKIVCYVNEFVEELLNIDSLLYSIFYESFNTTKLFRYEDYLKLENISKKDFLNILLLNTRSLNNSFEDLEHLINDSKTDLDNIALTETWLDNINENLFSLSNYTFHSQTRLTKIGLVYL